MKFPALHRWPKDARAAIALQKRLASRVRLVPIPTSARLIAGADAAFTADDRAVLAAVVVWDVVTQAPVASSTATRPCNFPYIPGLLSFRELPCILAAFRKLRVRPDAVLCDGHGLAHPRRLGIACLLGLWLAVPTVGCAKSRLLGTYDEPALERGSLSPLWDRGEQVGVVLRTRTDVKPVFVSPGHLCDHASAVRLTLAAATQYRLPEPARLAHQCVSALRRA
jgi:deoxyribonuclease V